MRLWLALLFALVAAPAVAQTPFPFVGRSESSLAPNLLAHTGTSNGQTVIGLDEAGALKQDYLFTPMGATTASTAEILFARSFDVDDYGAVAAANPANGAMNSLAFQAAFNACYGAGGGVVRVRSRGAAYHLATGLSETGNGCTLQGDRIPNWPGPVGAEAAWTNYGSWIACDDTSRPCIQFLGSGVVDGIDIWRTQPVPSTSAGTAWTPADVVAASSSPASTPWAIQFQQNFSRADHIQIANSSYGIDFEYPSNANIAGTYSGLGHIWAGCFVTCLRFHAVNDTMQFQDIHVRDIWQIGNSNVVAYMEGHLQGVDIEYLDNAMFDGLEIYKAMTALYFANATAVYGTSTLTHAAENLTFHNTQFNQVCQGLAVQNGTTVISAEFVGIIGQSDTDTNCAAAAFISAPTDYADITMTAARLSAVGNAVAQVGNGAGGKLTFNGLRIGSPLQPGSAPISGYDYFGNGGSAFYASANAKIAVSSGFGDIVAAPGAGPILSCASGVSGCLTSPTRLVPDWFRSASDGVDDAPSIQRAQTVGLPLDFQCRHYTINSAITVTTLAKWNACGWPEQPGPLPTAAGTWFDIGPAFIASATAPITITGNLATGSLVENIAIDEPGMTAPPIAVTNGSGQVTSWSPASWSPAAYTEVFRVTDAPGVTLRHLMFAGVNAGISSTGSGRTSLYDVRGQIFSYLVSIQEAYDVSRIVDVHDWPYWSSADPVMQYQQAHTQVVISDRNDTPMWDRIFALGVNAGIYLSSGSDGATTGAEIGSLSCDFTQFCIQVAAAADVQLHLANLRSYGQKWNTIYGSPVTMLPGSDIIEIDGQAVMQIGQVDSYGVDHCIFNFANGASASNIHVDSLYGQLGAMSSNSFLACFPTSGTASLLTINQPLLTPNAPSGFEQTNTGSNGSGVGTYQVATYSTVH